MTHSPAQIIRDYLDEQGGEVEVPFHNLLTTWGIGEVDPDARAAIERDLHGAGVSPTPGLRWVGPDTAVTLRLAPPPAAAPPPWAGQPELQATPASKQIGKGAIAALAVALVALVIGGGVAGYLLGRDSDEDLQAAKTAGERSGEREAARRQDPAGLRRERAAGRREGYRRAYQPAFDRAKSTALSAAPKSCGDAKTSDTPYISKVRAEGVDCAAALAFASSCKNPDTGCQGYTCDTVSVAYEAGEVTCTSGGRRIRFISGV